MKPLLLPCLLMASLSALCQSTDSLPLPSDTSSKLLQTVRVTGGKRPIEVGPDKIVLNLDAQPSAVGEQVLDVLRRSPGVTVDASENILLNGKTGVTVLIDGKPTQLAAQDLAQLLKSIEASNVAQIELIANPSARYDAAGNGGIINIKLKKSRTDGFNGNTTGSYVQSRHARQNGALNLNWRKAKTALFLNGGINNGLQHVVANNDRESGAQRFEQRSLEQNFFNGYSLRAGLDYSLTKKAALGVLWMLNRQSTTMDNGSTTLMQSPALPDTVFNTRSRAPFNNRRQAFNLNYSFTEQSLEYTFDADYTLYRSSVFNEITNDLRNGQGQKLGANSTNNDQQVQIRLYSVKGDLSKTLSPRLKLEAGFKMMATRTNNGLRVENREDGGSWGVDTGKTNRFLFAEDIRALYAALKGEKNRWSWQAGLRAEQTTVKGESTDLQQAKINRPDTAYLNLFPSLFLQYKLTEGHQLGLTANRRIDRPNYQDQNPFIYFLDALNREQGNPYLKPQFTNNIEISYTYKYATSFKVGYAHTSDYIDWLTYRDGKYTVQTAQNAGTRQMLSFSFSSPVKFTKAWSAYVSLTPYYHFYNIGLSGFGTPEQQRGGSWAFNGYMGNTVQLGKGWTGSVSGWFNFQNRATIYVSKPLGSLDLGVQKNIWKDKATLKLSLVDLFNTQRWEQRAQTAELRLNTYRKWESQNITFGFSWRFGNSELKKARERTADSEKDGGRIKS
jgi:iron complex outermembrane receptor protein